MRLLTDARNLLNRVGIDVTRWPHRPEAGVIDWALSEVIKSRGINCVIDVGGNRGQSAQRLRISFEAGQPLPLERGASARLLLSGLPPDQRREYLAPLAERDPEAAARVEIKAAQAAKQGYATSEEEFEQGVFAVSAPVFQGKRMIAVITVPSPLVRAPAPLQEKLLSQVRAAAQDLNEALRVSRR